MASRKRIKSIFKPLVIVVAAAYFVIDALTLSVLKPLLRKIVNLRLFALIVRWIASLSPYATLALFLIPLILLEPVKPLSAYLVASGQFKLGMRNDGKLFIEQVDAAEISPGEFADKVRSCVEKETIRTVMIDSLNGYQNAMPEEKFLILHMEVLGIREEGIAERYLEINGTWEDHMCGAISHVR